jgi:hypothetical protein
MAESDPYCKLRPAPPTPPEEICSCERASTPGDWDYYLEGSIRNYDDKVFALPSAMDALRRGQYFVADNDDDFVLDKVCKSLRLRGVEGITPEA